MKRSGHARATVGQAALPALGPVGRLGDRVIRIVVASLQFAGDLAATLARGVVPGNWRRTMREEFLRCLYQVGVRAVPAVVVSALLVGVGLVLQIIYWLEVADQEGSIGDFLVLVVVREISPVVAALIVIGRSGTAMLDEVSHMKLNGQIRMLESYGIDPTDFIAIPRIFATSLALFVLTMIFVYVALWSGYFGASAAALTTIPLGEFADEVLSSTTLGDHVLLVVKPMINGLVIAYVAIWLGLRVEPTVLAVRQTLPRGFVYSLLATFLIGVTVSAAV